jgi:hypothetical protein
MKTHDFVTTARLIFHSRVTASFFLFTEHLSMPALISKVTSISQSGVPVFQEMAAGRHGDLLTGVQSAERVTIPHQISVGSHAVEDHIVVEIHVLQI